MFEFNNVDEFLLYKRNTNFPYPYKILYHNKKQILEMFMKLQKYNITKHLKKQQYSIKNIDIPSTQLKFLKTPLLIITQKQDHTNWNELSDMFNEQCRVQCKLFNQKHSSFDYFNHNTNHVAKYALQKFHKITPFTLRESLYLLHKECTSHRPNLIMGMIQLFNAKYILDFSSGWGDRLIGAMAMNVKYYCGVDPNKCLHKNYQQIIQFFGKMTTGTFNMINAPIESAILPDIEFDLIYTSPPYFDLEQYSQNNTQSSVRYNSEKKWFDIFLKTAINKCWKKLKKNGYMCLNINQKNKNENYIKSLLQYMQNNIPDAVYLGVISYANETIDNPQPIWIWKKYIT